MDSPRTSSSDGQLLLDSHAVTFGVIFVGSSMAIPSSEFKPVPGEVGQAVELSTSGRVTLDGDSTERLGPLVCFLSSKLPCDEEELVVQCLVDDAWVDLCTLTNASPSHSCQLNFSGGRISKLRIRGRECRICFEPQGGDSDSKLVAPCACKGSQRWVHRSCLTQCGGQVGGKCTVCKATFRITDSMSERQLQEAVERATAAFDQAFGIDSTHNASPTPRAPLDLDNSPRHRLPPPPLVGSAPLVGSTTNLSRTNASTRHSSSLRLRGHHRRQGSREFECDINVRGHRRSNSRELEHASTRHSSSLRLRGHHRRQGSREFECDINVRGHRRSSRSHTGGGGGGGGDGRDGDGGVRNHRRRRRSDDASMRMVQAAVEAGARGALAAAAMLRRSEEERALAHAHAHAEDDLIPVA
ncbi:hypothetical protein RI054_17g79410 [Pseudoscourfieldia marina]